MGSHFSTPPQQTVDKAQHPAFPQPADRSTLVWRYLDLAKYVSLLTRKSLYLASTDRFGDPYEGSLPRLNREVWLQEVLTAFGPDVPNALVLNLQQSSRDQSRLAKKFRAAFYANCWRLANDESEAMWKLYCGADQGVAIVLPYGRLVESIGDPFAYVGCVSYLDYSRELMKMGNALYPFMHKRTAFVHEQEVRIVKPGDWPGLSLNPDIVLPAGIELAWNPEQYVEKIVVNPYARSWFHEAVGDVTRALAPTIADRVCESAMAAEPTF
jgi:hypothetical protein